MDNQLIRALAVMVLAPNIRSFLEEHDPQALKQALIALRDSGYKCSETIDEKKFWTVNKIGAYCGRNGIYPPYKY